MKKYHLCSLRTTSLSFLFKAFNSSPFHLNLDLTLAMFTPGLTNTYAYNVHMYNLLMSLLLDLHVYMYNLLMSLLLDLHVYIYTYAGPSELRFVVQLTSVYVSLLWVLKTSSLRLGK